MYSHSCSCLPNKNQPAFTGSISQNLDIFRTFTTKTFTNFEENTATMHLPVNVNVDSVMRSSSNYNDRPNLPRKTSSIMQLAYNFRDSAPKLKSKHSTCNFSSFERIRANCKTYFTQYDCVSTMPLVSSHLVGGFVGSKSQLGRRPSSNGVGVNMWDIIREVLSEYFGKSKSMPDKEKCLKASMDNSTLISLVPPKYDKQYLDQTKPINISSSSIYNGNMSGESCVRETKQSYADVAKAAPINIETTVKIVEDERYGQKLCYPQSISKNTAENPFKIINRDRISTSECSADSEDSFIVFEYCETDEKSEDDGISSSISDDETSVLDLQNSSAENSPIVRVSAYFPLKEDSFHFSPNKKKGARKVRFAEGPSLVKVHTMLAWDYAYRAARRGPWEMMARDSERFKCRIRNTEMLLKPVLDPDHRAVVYLQRFADPAETK